MRAEQVIETAEHIARPIVAEMGLELVEVQFRQEAGWVLRLFIDRESGGIGVDDCASVSRQVAARLEAEDIIPHAYTLEVSSPGLERPLKRLEDFPRFVGRKVRIKLSEPLAGQYVFTGPLTAADLEGQKITLTAEEISGSSVTVDFAAVSKARLSL